VLRIFIKFGHTHSAVAYSGGTGNAKLAGKKERDVYYERITEILKDDTIYKLLF
jgi:hypothetical protein